MKKSSIDHIYSCTYGHIKHRVCFQMFVYVQSWLPRKKCIKKFWMFRSVLDIINQIRLASHIFQPKIDSSINICWTVSIFFPSNSFLFSYSVSINTKIVAYWCSFYIFSLYRKINYINLNEVFKSRSTTSMLRSARLIHWCRCFYFMLFFSVNLVDHL